ncbi:superoxide dismutase family protein [Streptomyces sp. NPDC050617]|uniref:superoxide dismutase family protein n=1 Tax=Streptomyces sp. NPDC050617 TaxID=3154628 RepID=UPI0034131E47
MPFVATMLTAAVALSPTAGVHSTTVTVDEHFGSAAHPPYTAVTYDPVSVPEAARVVVTERRHEGGGTTVALRLEGVQANRTFGAHAHSKPCGAKPEDSGPHYQDVRDPKQPSTDPAYANPRNEVWLDLTTDEDGDGRSRAAQSWHFRYGEARSVVVHEHKTSTEPGHAGMAGARLACVNVPFA